MVYNIIKGNKPVLFKMLWIQSSIILFILL